MSRKRKKTYNRPKPEKFCDLGVCDCCQYIGEGDFLCDKHMEIVVSDWTPTESCPMCEQEIKGHG